MSSFRRILSNRNRLPSPPVTLENTLLPPNPAKTNFLRDHLITLPEIGKKGFLRRFLHRNAITQLPEILSLPVGEKLREKLKGISNAGDRLRLEGLAPPSTEAVDGGGVGVSVEDVRKLLTVPQMEKAKAKLRASSMSSISYSEFVEFCVAEFGSEDRGVEFAKMLDQSGNVVVFGNIVFLRPDQLAKSMENILSQSMATPNDPRRKQLEQLEEQKAIIDRKARTQVQTELYCGLGFLLVQTLGFMRLTFWELSWDVMEPICFFVTSLHFALAYGFFLRTSTEPSFEGYFQRRFRTKQQKLMKIHNFDVDKYNELRNAFYPYPEYGIPQPQCCGPCEREVGRFASAIRG